MQPFSRNIAVGVFCGLLLSGALGVHGARAAGGNAPYLLRSGPGDSLHVLRSTAFTVDDGLSQNMVLSTLTDRRGFVWAGTKDGLNRFDGRQFIRYRHRPGADDGLPDNYIEALFEDAEGRIWVGTGKGIAVYDLRRDRFITVCDSLRPDRFRTAVRAVDQDAAGRIWAAGAGGVWRIDPADDSEEQASDPAFRFRIAEVGFPPGTDRDTEALVTTARGDKMLVYAGGEAGLFSTEAAAHPSAQQPFTLRESVPVSAAATDGRGRIWYGKTDLFVRHPLTETVRAFPREDFPGEMKIHALAFSPSGKLWMSAADLDTKLSPRGAAFRIDPEDFSLSRVRLLPENRLLISLAFTENDLLCAGTNGYGLLRIDLKSAHFACYPTREMHVDVLAQSASPPVWLPGRFPAFMAPRPDGSLRVFSVLDQREVSPEYLRRMSGGEVPGASAFNAQLANHMTRDAAGNYWVYSAAEGHDREALICYDADLRPVAAYSLKLGVSQLIRPAPDGGLFLSAHHDLFHFDPETEKLQKLCSLPRGVPLTVFFTSLLDDGEGRLWLGHDYGLTEHRLSTGRTVHHFAERPALSYGVLSLLNDPFAPEEVLWAGTEGGGLVRLEKSSGAVRVFGEADGLPNAVVYGILADDEGMLWCSTNSGLFCFDPTFPERETAAEAGGTRDVETRIEAGAAPVIRTYSRDEGLPVNEFNRHFSGRLADGRLSFESLSGLVAFRPSDLRPDTFAPAPVFTDFQVFYKSVFEAGSDRMPAGVMPEALLLTHRENRLSFHYVAPDARAPHKTEYRTKLEGIDKEWSSPVRSGVTSYGNLSPGTYTFRVRAGGTGGGTAREIAVPVTILKPWWLTAPAVLLWLLLIGAAVYGIYRLRMNRLRLRYNLAARSAEAERLQELDRMKNRFFSDITHEFRTPLTLIISPIEKLLTRTEDARAAAELRRVYRNANHLLRLINQLLDLSKIDSGLMRIEPVRGEVVSFVREVTDSFRSFAVAKKIDIRLHTTHPRADLCFDPGMLEKVLYNILYNALKFTPEGGEVTVRLDLLPEVPPHTRLEISVKDTGPGMSAEARARAFDRYYTDPENKGKGTAGTGIGLALVRELTELSGGETELRSSPGAGSTFTVRIPVSPPDDPDGRPERLPTAERAPAAEEAEAGTHDTAEAEDPDELPLVLVAEDNEDLRNFVKDCLSERYRVIEAVNGEEALEKARTHIPDAVVCDVMMPVKDGFEFLDACKASDQTSHIPVVMLTAKTNRADRETGLRKGAEAYLTKPFYEAELTTLLHNLMEARRISWERYRNEVKKEREATAGSREEAFITRFKQTAEKDLSNSALGVEDFCRELAMSRTQLHRKVKALTGMSAGQFLRHIRLEHARRMLELGDLNVSEVAYACGFSSHSYFSKCFSEVYGRSPREYRGAFG